MEISESEIKIFESTYVEKVSKLFKAKSKLHHKWYSVTSDTLNQFGTINHLFLSKPEQIIFETYDHGKPSQVEILFFNENLIEIPFIVLSNGGKIGRRISDRNSDKKYEIITPQGEHKIIELGSNLYSKVFKTIITKFNDSLT